MSSRPRQMSPEETGNFFRLFFHRAVPLAYKGLFVVAVGLYALLPLDLITDIIPLLGQVDDIGFIMIAAQVFTSAANNRLLSAQQITRKQLVVRQRAGYVALAVFFVLAGTAFAVAAINNWLGLGVALAGYFLSRRLATDYYNRTLAIADEPAYADTPEKPKNTLRSDRLDTMREAFDDDFEQSFPPDNTRSAR